VVLLVEQIYAAYNPMVVLDNGEEELQQKMHKKSLVCGKASSSGTGRYKKKKFMLTKSSFMILYWLIAELNSFMMLLELNNAGSPMSCVCNMHKNCTHKLRWCN
jgi:hypothetical protein